MLSFCICSLYSHYSSMKYIFYMVGLVLHYYMGLCFISNFFNLACTTSLFFNRNILMTLSDLERSWLVHSLRWVSYAVIKKVIYNIRSCSVSPNWFFFFWLLLLLWVFNLSCNVWMLKNKKNIYGTFINCEVNGNGVASLNLEETEIYVPSSTKY